MFFVTKSIVHYVTRVTTVIINKEKMSMDFLKGDLVSYKKYFYTFSKNNLLNLNSKLRDDNEFFKFQPKSDYFTSKSSQMILV